MKINVPKRTPTEVKDMKADKFRDAVLTKNAVATALLDTMADIAEQALGMNPQQAETWVRDRFRAHFRKKL